jgi:DNA polymerase-3 subunit beta
MKISVLQENLNKGLAIAVRAVATRPQLPILTHVLLDSSKGRLKISSTDLETGINLWIGAKIEKEGAISVPAKILAEYVASLPPEKVDLEVKEGLLKVSSGRFEASFNGLAASEFPKIPSVQGKSSLSIEPKPFIEAVSQVALAAASDEARPVLTGIYLFTKDSKLNLVATDGYRLSVKNLKSPLKTAPTDQFKKGFIVPAQAFQEAARIAGEENKPVNFYFTPDSNQLIFLIGDVEVITRLIEGKFPEFEKIIPSGGKTKTMIETENFTRVIRIASIFARESANIVRFQFGKEGIEISANMAQVGENKSLVEAKVEGGEDKIAFNSRYLLDFLSVVGSESFQFEMSGPLSPGIFRPEKDPSFLHVIMPVRVQE